MWDDYEIDGNLVHVIHKGKIIDTVNLDAIVEDYLDENYGKTE